MAENESHIIENIKRGIENEATVTGIVDSLFIEGIEVPKEFILDAFKDDNKKENDGTTPPSNKSGT